MESLNLLKGRYDNDGNGGDDPEEPCNYWDGGFQVYYLRSSVMGEVIAEAHHLGGRNKVEVPLGEGTLIINSGQYEHTDALGFSKRASIMSSPIINFPNSELYSEEKDAVGTNMGMSSPYLGVESPYGDPLAPTFLTPLLDDLSTSYVNGQRATCELDGVAVSCQRLLATSGSSLATKNMGLPVEVSKGSFIVPTEYKFRLYWNGPPQERRLIGVQDLGITNWTTIDVSPFADLYNYIPYEHGFRLEFKNNNAGRTLLERGLKSDKCKNAIEKIIAEIGKSVELRADSILEMFDEINNQAYLGLRLNTLSSTHFNNELNEIYGFESPTVFGSGLATRFHPNRSLNISGEIVKGDYALVGVIQRTVWGKDLGSNKVQKQITEESYFNFETIVHELIHVMAKSGTIDHKIMDGAALALDEDLSTRRGITGLEVGNLFDFYIRKNCTPEEFRAGRPIKDTRFNRIRR